MYYNRLYQSARHRAGVRAQGAGGCNSRYPPSAALVSKLPLLASLSRQNSHCFTFFFLSLFLSNTRVCFILRFHYQNISFSSSMLSKFLALPLFFYEQTHTFCYPSVKLNCLPHGFVELTLSVCVCKHILLFERDNLYCALQP